MSTADMDLTTVTRDLDDKSSPLRLIVDDHQELMKRWRQQVLHAIKDQPTIPLARQNTGGMVGHAIDYRIRWWLTGVDELGEAVLEGLARCKPTTRAALLGAFADVAGLPAGELGAVQERALAQVAVAAATVEPLFRVGPCRAPCRSWAWNASWSCMTRLSPMC